MWTFTIGSAATANAAQCQSAVAVGVIALISPQRDERILL
jgi:hypothetical protein